MLWVRCKSIEQLEEEGYEIIEAGKFIKVRGVDGKCHTFMKRTFVAIFDLQEDVQVRKFNPRWNDASCISSASGKRFRLEQELVSHVVD